MDTTVLGIIIAGNSAGAGVGAGIEACGMSALGIILGATAVLFIVICSASTR